MKKKWVAIFLLMIFILSCVVTKGIAEHTFSVVLNGEKLNFDVLPIQAHDDILIPLRSVLESMGGQVTWHRGGRVTATIEGNSVEFVIGERIAIKNGLQFVLSHSPSLIDSRVLVPSSLFSQAFHAEVDSNLQIKQVHILYNNDNTSKAKELVLHYLQLLERASTENISEQKWRDVFSESALTSIRGSQMEKYYTSYIVSYPRVLSWRYCTASSDFRTILVTASYQLDFPHHPTNPGLNIWRKEVYEIIQEKDKWVIDSIREERRHHSDLPRYVLNPEETTALERNWQRNNYYTKEEILELNQTLIEPAFRLIYASHNFDGPVETMPHEQQVEYYQKKSLFLPEVINSSGWNSFLEITAHYDLFIQVLQSVSTENTIQLSLVADLFAQASFVPAFFDIELKKANNTWRISKISNVSAFSSSYHLKIDDPDKFEMLATLYNFWRVRAEWFGVNESFVAP